MRELSPVPPHHAGLRAVAGLPQKPDQAPGGAPVAPGHPATAAALTEVCRLEPLQARQWGGPALGGHLGRAPAAAGAPLTATATSTAAEGRPGAWKITITQSTAACHTAKVPFVHMDYACARHVGYLNTGVP